MLAVLREPVLVSASLEFEQMSRRSNHQISSLSLSLVIISRLIFPSGLFSTLLLINIGIYLFYLLSIFYVCLSLMFPFLSLTYTYLSLSPSASIFLYIFYFLKCLHKSRRHFTLSFLPDFGFSSMSLSYCFSATLLVSV